MAGDVRHSMISLESINPCTGGGGGGGGTNPSHQDRPPQAGFTFSYGFMMGMTHFSLLFRLLQWDFGLTFPYLLRPYKWEPPFMTPTQYPLTDGPSSPLHTQRYQRTWREGARQASCWHWVSLAGVPGPLRGPQVRLHPSLMPHRHFCRTAPPTDECSHGRYCNILSSNLNLPYNRFTQGGGGGGSATPGSRQDEAPHGVLPGGSIEGISALDEPIPIILTGWSQ